MGLAEIGFLAKLGAVALWRKLFPGQKGGSMNPKDALSMWDTFKTGTGLVSWIGAVVVLGLAALAAMMGQMSWLDAGVFASTVIMWAIAKLRSRYATMKLQATTDAVFQQNQRLLAQGPTKTS